MNELTVKFPHTKILGCPTVTADGEQLKMTLRGNCYEGKLTTDKTNVEIAVTRHYELEGKHWFLMSMLFFFISLLGIFNVHREKRFYSIDYRAAVSFDGVSQLNFRLNPFKVACRAAETYGNCNVREQSNVFFVKKFLNKRRKALLWTKAAIWLVVLALAVALPIVLL